jgi:hypothetical protein
MDTLVPDFHVKPDPELDLLLAGRQRCYFHAIDDPTCEENVWHARSWEQWAASIPKRELDVFEYYTDMLLRSLGITFPNTILADLRYYWGIGVHRMNIVVICAIYSPSAHLLNYLAYAAGCWDPAADYADMLRDYCDHAYGPAAALLERYWRTMEQATTQLVTHGVHPEMSDDEPMHQLIVRVRAAVPEFEEAGRVLVEASKFDLDEGQRRRLRRERAIWQFTLLQARVLLEHLQGLYYFASAEEGHLRNEAARKPDGTFVGYDLVRHEILHRARPSSPRGYVEAMHNLSSAVELHEASRGVLPDAGSALLDSTGLTAPLGYPMRAVNQGASSARSWPWRSATSRSTARATPNRAPEPPGRRADANGLQSGIWIGGRSKWLTCASPSSGPASGHHSGWPAGANFRASSAWRSTTGHERESRPSLGSSRSRRSTTTPRG